MKRKIKPGKACDIEATAARWVARRDAGLSPVEGRELQRWLDVEPRHSRAMAFYASTWDALAKPARGGSGALLEQHLETLARRRRHWRVAASAATLVILLAGGVRLWRPVEQAPAPGASSALVLTPSKQTLPDGSLVELKESARIAVDYSASMRRVALVAGEAHFEVQEDLTRPFVVSAAGVDVRAVGTAFTVYKGTATVEVLVTHGKVAVEKSPPSALEETGAAPAPLATLEAGKFAVVVIGEAVTVPAVRAVAPAELSQRVAWRSPRLEFTRTPLNEAVALINRHAPPNAPRLAVSDPTVAAMRISGVFRADNIEAFVLLLEGVFGVKAESSGNAIFLRSAH